MMLYGELVGEAGANSLGHCGVIGSDSNPSPSRVWTASHFYANKNQGFGDRSAPDPIRGVAGELTDQDEIIRDLIDLVVKT